MVDCSSLLQNRSARLEDYEVGDALNLVAGCEFRIPFGIDFHHDSVTCHIGGSARDLRRRDPAWTAPGGPKVHKDWNPGVLHNFRKLFRSHIQRFIRRRQCIFAGTTSPDVSKMRCGDTVFTPAGWAGPNDWHKEVNSPGRQRCLYVSDVFQDNVVVRGPARP
jgi:hypothetical protein